MTIEYTADVATGSRGLGNFWRLLFRWVGSIYKILLPDLCVYMLMFYSINIPYRYYIADRPDKDMGKAYFHLFVQYSKDAGKLIPMQFILGFYVSQVATRWWAMFMTLPWPDNLAVTVASAVRGHDERGRLMRRTILRYVNTSLVMTLVTISPVARSRFPTLDDLVSAGFLVPHERLIIEGLNEKTPGPKNFVPIVWAAALVSRARKEGRIADDFSVFHIMEKICLFRQMSIDLLSYDWLSIPLVYTQVATLATYVYFLSCLMSRQFIKGENTTDIYVPVFLIMEYLFMVGWLKVAEISINPFGEDDDDFEVNWLIDRNITVSYCIVDEMNNEFPEMLKDAFWDGGIPEELMYTIESLKYKTDGMGAGSVGSQEDKKDNMHLQTTYDFNDLPKHMSDAGDESEKSFVALYLESNKIAPEYQDSDEKLAERDANADKRVSSDERPNEQSESDKRPDESPPAATLPSAASHTSNSLLADMFR